MFSFQFYYTYVHQNICYNTIRNNDPKIVVKRFFALANQVACVHLLCNETHHLANGTIEQETEIREVILAAPQRPL
jgi:hypothetical protein